MVALKRYIDPAVNDNAPMWLGEGVIQPAIPHASLGYHNTSPLQSSCRKGLECSVPPEAYYLAGLSRCHGIISGLWSKTSASWQRGSLTKSAFPISASILALTLGNCFRCYGISQAIGRPGVESDTYKNSNESRVKPSKRMLGDKAYDSAELREELDERRTKPVIPNRCNRKQPFSFSKRLCKLRWRIESAFKDFKRIATRYDRLDRNYHASVCDFRLGTNFFLDLLSIV